VTDAKGEKTSGEFVAIRGTELELRHSGGWFSAERRFVFTEEAVRRIENDDSTWEGTLIGTALGVAIAVVSLKNWEGDESGIMLAWAPPLIGGVVGDTLDGARRRVLFVSPRQPTVRLSPVGESRRAALAVKVRF
jgi:hypothetical protein